MTASDYLSPGQFGLVEHPSGPQSEGVDVVPDLEHTITVPHDMPLHTEQHEINPAAVEHYTKTSEPYDHFQRFSMSGEGTPRPVVVSWQGKNWLADGHHRAIASRVKGEPSFEAWHVDPERDQREYDEWANRGRGRA